MIFAIGLAVGAYYLIMGAYRIVSWRNMLLSVGVQVILALVSGSVVLGVYKHPYLKKRAEN